MSVTGGREEVEGGPTDTEVSLIVSFCVDVYLVIHQQRVIYTVHPSNARGDFWSHHYAKQ